MCVFGSSFAEDKPQYKSAIEYIQKTGRLWGISEVWVDADATVILIDAKSAGCGYGMMMLTPESKIVESVNLKVSQSCTLTDGHHASIGYKLKSVKNGVMIIEVTETFDARSFGKGVKEENATVSVTPYSDKEKETQQAAPSNR